MPDLRNGDKTHFFHNLTSAGKCDSGVTSIYFRIISCMALDISMHLPYIEMVNTATSQPERKTTMTNWQITNIRSQKSLGIWAGETAKAAVLNLFAATSIDETEYDELSADLSATLTDEPADPDAGRN